jgi:predicted RNA binding protein YcfA (HicA-like mRNA interferase family)
LTEPNRFGIIPSIMKVRDILKRLAEDGWTQVGQKGSHRQFAHSTKRGKVTVNGHPTDEITGRLLHWIFDQAGWPWDTRP